MKHRLLFAAAAALICTAAVAQQAAPEEAFDRYAAALAKGDLQDLLAMHTDDSILVPSNGGPFVQGKEAIGAYYKALFAGSKARQAIKATPPKWQVYGDTAVRTSNGLFEVETEQGKQQFPLRNLYVFHKEGGNWKLTTTHISKRDASGSAPSTVAPTASK